MKKYFILFFLSLALLGCKKKEIYVNEFTFDIDGVHYDLSFVEQYYDDVGSHYFDCDGRHCTELWVNGHRYNKNSYVDYLFYSFISMGHNSTESYYGGQFLDRLDKCCKQTVFKIPDTANHSFFWIDIDKGMYNAISGHIEMINEVNLDTESFVPHKDKNYYKAHGTFDFIMVNRDNELDTIHVTNGKFKYQCYTYREAYQVDE